MTKVFTTYHARDAEQLELKFVISPNVKGDYKKYFEQDAEEIALLLMDCVPSGLLNIILSKLAELKAGEVKEAKPVEYQKLAIQFPNFYETDVRERLVALHRAKLNWNFFKGWSDESIGVTPEAYVALVTDELIESVHNSINSAGIPAHAHRATPYRKFKDNLYKSAEQDREELSEEGLLCAICGKPSPGESYPVTKVGVDGATTAIHACSVCIKEIAHAHGNSISRFL